MSSHIVETPTTVKSYRFGLFELEPATQELRKNGSRVRLQPKVFLLLLELLQRPGEVVSRAELRNRLWPEDVHVDYEQGLNIAVKKLRDRLFDDVDSPRYIETIPGLGYRFIAAVEPVGSESEGVVAVAGLPSRDGAARRYAKIGLVVIALVVVLGTTWLRWPKPIPFNQRDWVVVADIENHSGDEEFDGVASRVVRDLLAESRHVNVASGARVADTLKLMRVANGSRFDVATAREVAQRDGGIRLVIGGDIVKVGERYRVVLRVVDPGSDAILASFSESSPKKTDVLLSLERLTGRLRQGLGDNLPPTVGPPLQRVTSKSLKAVKFYTEGMVKIDSAKFAEAIPWLNAAVQEDPEFASAHIYLAHAHANTAVLPWDEIRTHFQRALDLAPNVHEAERLFIEGSYYQRFHGEKGRSAEHLAKALEAYEHLVAAYPDHYWGWKNLMHLRSGDPRFADAALQLSRIRPNSVVAVSEAIIFLEETGRQPEARTLAAEWDRKLMDSRLLEASPGEAASVRFYPVKDLINAGRPVEASERLGRLLREAGAHSKDYQQAINRQAAARYWWLLGNRSKAYDSLTKVNNHYLNAFFAGFEGRRLEQRKELILSIGKRDPTFLETLLLAHTGDSAPARQFLTKNPDINDLRRWLLMAEIALAHGERRVAVGRFERALQEMRKKPVFQSGGLPDYLIMDYSRLLLAMGDHPRNMALLEEDRERNRKSLWRLEFDVNLLRSYVRLGKIEEAERLIAELTANLAAGEADHPFLRAVTEARAEVDAQKKRSRQGDKVAVR